MDITTTQGMKQALTDKLRLGFGVTPEEADDAQVMRAAALVLRDVMTERGVESRMATRREEKRKVHYLSMEFLLGRSLEKNAYNLGVSGVLREAIGELGFRAADIFEVEPDAGLGNGGLGRLAACYLDSMTTLDIPAAGYSICYELGIFRQRIVDGQQVELPDNWKDIGGAWLMPKPQETEEVLFGGTVRKFWDNGRLHVVPEGATKVLAVPCDMEITGYGTEHVNPLRLWDAKSPTPVDMSLFSQGEYLRASEQEAMAETIAKILYPEDNHYEGKSLRLKQQYFFVSATMQSIMRKHIEVYGTAANFHEKNVIQINDTHPALVIPELMRILMDDAGFDWDTAWNITKNSVAYTNHTVLAEALERWPQQLMETLLPRVWEIITEIAHRYQKQVENFYHDPAKTAELAIVWDGQVRMANLCIAGGMAVNGVSALHSDILRHDVFRWQYQMEPEKFKNVTNGIDHRRWLAQINPRLDGLIADLCGGRGYLLHPEELKKLEAFAGDGAVLARLDEIKRANKLDFAAYVKKTQGVTLNTDAIFDVQVKRLHEYKRQLLNAMHIIYLYQKLQDDPSMELQPRTFLFGAKAAPGYAVAKRIIHLINSLANQINSDPLCSGTTAGRLSGELPRVPRRASDARERGQPADLHRRQGGQRHGQHEVHDERCADRRHARRRERRDARGAWRREYVPLRPARGRGRAPEGAGLRAPAALRARRRAQARGRSAPHGLLRRCELRRSRPAPAPARRIYAPAGLRLLLRRRAAHGEDLRRPRGVGPYVASQHRAQRYLRRRPRGRAVRGQHLARPAQVSKAEERDGGAVSFPRY